MPALPQNALWSQNVIGPQSGDFGGRLSRLEEVLAAHNRAIGFVREIADKLYGPMPTSGAGINKLPETSGAFSILDRLLTEFESQQDTLTVELSRLSSL